MTTRTEAQTKIRDHVKRRGHEFVDVKVTLVRYWWRICNNALFHGKLHPPRIHVKTLKSDYGYCHLNGKEIIIAISTAAWTRRLFMTTLVHEMVHQWELEQNGRYWGHGKGFHEWQNRVKKNLGLDLSVHIYEEDYITDGQKQLYKRRYKNPKRSRAC